MKRTNAAADKVEIQGVTMEIRKGVPPPPPKQDKFKWSLILKRMEVGDCFMIPDGLEKKCRSAARLYGREHGMEFEVAHTDEGWGCWRTK